MMQVTLWGTRGSIPVSGAQFVRHGGATTCLEVSAGEEQIIIDCGTGLAEFGKSPASMRRRDLHIYQTHMHWDHVQGFPFFRPLFNAEVCVNMYAVRRQGQTMRDVLRGQMSQPTFPVGLDIIPAKLEFHELEIIGDSAHGELKMRWQEMTHPGGSTAYRFDYKGCSVVFSGDVEVQQGSFDDLVELSRGADILIMDAQYFCEEYPTRRGFGHSTPIDAVEVALKAGVKRLVLTHHDPTHDDELLAKKLHMAREHAAPEHLLVENAYDGLVLRVESEHVELSARAEMKASA